jgi:hypothetical protein
MKRTVIAFQTLCGIWLLYFGVTVIVDRGPMRFSDKLPFVVAEFFLAGCCFVLAADTWYKL